MTDIIPLDFEGENIRVIMVDGEPRWALPDLCRVLEIENSRRVAARLPDDAKGVITVNTPGGPQPVTFINEVALYKVILTSRKPGAERFVTWAATKIRDLRCYGVAFVDDDADGTRARAVSEQRNERLDDYTSVGGWLGLRGIRNVPWEWKGQIGKAAVRLCDERGIFVRRPPGAHNMYPMHIIAEAYRLVIGPLTDPSAGEIEGGDPEGV